MEEQQEKKKRPKDAIWKHTRIGTPKYKKPDDLWQDAITYFDWCDNNPVDAPSGMMRYQKQKEGSKKEMKMHDYKEDISRPYTLFGLCAWLGVPRWYRFKESYEGKDGFDEVFLAIENVIASQQIDGAMTGVFKENLTARLNGLADRNQSEIMGEIGVDASKTFKGFGFLPVTMGLANSPKLEEPKIEELPEPEPIYAEIVDTSKK